MYCVRIWQHLNRIFSAKHKSGFHGFIDTARYVFPCCMHTLLEIEQPSQMLLKIEQSSQYLVLWPCWLQCRQSMYT